MSNEKEIKVVKMKQIAAVYNSDTEHTILYGVSDTGLVYWFDELRNLWVQLSPFGEHQKFTKI